MRFFAVAAASIVSMGVAGSVARRGGIRLGYEIQQAATRQGGALAGRVDKGVASFRTIERYLDDLEGITRTYQDNNPNVLFRRAGRRIERSDTTWRSDSANIRLDNPDMPEWTVREEIQQRMVKQARRLPYELPGFYAADKLLIDPILGQGEEKKVNWNNPVDVIGDFASESLRNIAFNVMPFEAGLGAAKQGYRSIAMKIAHNPGNVPGMDSVRFMLEQMGANATNVLNSTMKFSQQSIGAFSNLIQDAQHNARSYEQVVRQASTQITHQRRNPLGNSNNANRLFKDAWQTMKGEDFRRAALDSLPGPFKGMASALQRVKGHYDDIGETFDDWQDVISGRKDIANIRAIDPDRYYRLTAYMQKGGGTHIEQYANAAHDLGGLGSTLPGGAENVDFRNSKFHKTRKEQIFKGVLVDSLVSRAGLRHEEALKFVRYAERITPMDSSATRQVQFGQRIAERIQFTSKPFHGPGGEQEWWNDLISHVNKHKVTSRGLTPGDLGQFKSALRDADIQFNSSSFRNNMDATIAKQWDTSYKDVIARQATASLKSIAQPFESFTGAALKGNEEFLITRSAQRLGITTYDASGNLLPTSIIRNELRRRGMEPTNLRQMRGFLMDQKDITPAWYRGGANLFGFRPLSVGQAMGNGFFSANEAGAQEHVKRFIEERTRRAGKDQLSLYNSNAFYLKVGGAYTNASGQVIDIGRIGRGVRGVMDMLASETKLPILNFNPLQIMGYNALRVQSRQAAVRMIDARSHQPFLTPGSRPNDEFLLWTREAGRSARGRVFGITGKTAAATEVRAYSGSFRALATNAEAMVGRYGRVLVGDTGIPSSQNHDRSPWRIPGTNIELDIGRFKRAFDISQDQGGSLFFGQQSLIRRWSRARSQSNKVERLKNPYRLAEEIGSDRFHLAAFDSNMSEGTNALITALRNYGFSNNTLRQIANDPQFRHIFEPIPGLDMSNIADAALPSIVKRVMQEDNNLFQGLTRDSRTAARKLQDRLRGLINQGDSQIDGWSLTTSEYAQQAGVSRRIDQLRNEFSDYLITSSQFREELQTGRAADIDGTITGLFNKIEDMFSSGKISKSEKSEARAAILSLQFEVSRNRAFRTIQDDVRKGALQWASPHSINMETVDNMLSFGSTHVKEALREFGSFRAGSDGGFMDEIKRLGRREFAAVPYDKPSEVNPFGSDTLLAPTLGTVAERSGLRNAIRGVSGATWSDPNSVSAASMIPTHMMLRLNRYFETFGIGLDPTQYRGPLDFYARGLVGKRIAPLYAAGVGAMTVDRTLGGIVNKDEEGNPIYSPLILGYGADLIAAAQIGAAGVVPGGQTAAEKKEELMYGEIPIRQGRYWLLGNQPYKGGRIQYYRPSWYRRFKSGAAYTPEMNETPIERSLFGYDFSPLRPLDPYRREREDYYSRPYPVSGDYFTGPWGPLNPILNQTVGRVLKPRRMMHQEEMDYTLGAYAPVGEGGAYFTGALGQESAQRQSSINAAYASSGPGTPSSAIMYPGMGYANPRGYASREVRGRAESMANLYLDRARYPGTYVTVGESLVPYGVPAGAGVMSPRIVPSNEPVNPGSASFMTRNLGYRTQEILGIYGFGLGTLRSSLGLGNQDLTPNVSMLEPASRGYSASKAFWNLNLGGTGDIPLPLESRYSNFELSEIIRRFVPRDPSGITYVNDLPNLMGMKYPWLPGADYPLASVKTGDPYTSVTDAEIRLPGTGYARANMLFPDQYGKIGMANMHDILGSIAPWSKEYERMDSLVNGADLTPIARAKVNQTRAQVENMRIKNEFSPYKYKYQTAAEVGQHPVDFALGRGWEWLSHRDSFFNTKFLHVRTAAEDWERDNVYGATFPSWSSPIDSYLKPFMQKSTQRDPFTAISAGGTIGFLFGASPRAKAFGAVTGGIAGGIASGFGKAYEAITGERYIPQERRKQIALEEYTDILKYTRSVVNATRAIQTGDMAAAQYFAQQSRQTMYGVDLNSTPEQIANVVPSRKREHFKAMMYAPPQEREQILSTASRLERRILQAAWGMRVEARPNLPEYFEDHELPPPNSEVWSPLLDMEHVKIKVGQSLGLDMAQMGYYPQQITEANLINPSYPDMFARSSSSSVMAQLRNLLRMNGGGSVSAIPNVLGGDRVELMAGVY